MKKKQEIDEYELYQKHLTKLQELPPKTTDLKHILTLKQQQDRSNYYRQIDRDLLLHHRSTIPQILEYIQKFIGIQNSSNKTNKKQFTISQKFLLSNFISVYITQKFQKSSLYKQKNQIKQYERRDDKKQTKQLLTQWKQLCFAFNLYKVKEEYCSINEVNPTPNNLKQNFVKLQKTIENVKKSKQKFEQIRKIMRQFYQLILK